MNDSKNNIDPSAGAVFVDRDGTIIHDPGYISDPDEVRLLPSAAEGLKLFRDYGFRLVVVTNQSGIGRGYYERQDFDRVNDRMTTLLDEHDVDILAIYHCPHKPSDRCICRKPNDGMLQSAADDHNIDLSKSVMIGDNPTDIQAGLSAGTQVVKIGSDEDGFSGVVAADLLTAAKIISEWTQNLN